MNEYLRSGNDDGILRTSEDGGYLVPSGFYGKFSSYFSPKVPFRSAARVVACESSSYDILTDGIDGVGRVTIPLHELSALPKVSQRLLGDSAFDVEDWLAGRIADKFARSEACAFITGDGADKPRGLLTYPTVDNDIWAWGSLGYVATGSVAGIDSADPIVDLVYAVDTHYRSNGTFMLNSKTAGTIRKLKDSDGRFVWSDGLSAGDSARLFGYPVVIAEDMPDIEADAFAIAFGDFSAGYTIAERPDLRVLRDPFSARPHVLFYATKRVGGDVSDFAAIKLLKFSEVSSKEPTDG